MGTSHGSVSRMARPTLVLPETVDFTAEIPIRISDINYGGHLGNDAVLAIVHEVRIRFLAQYGYTEHNCAGSGLIMADALIVFRSEAFHGDVLRADVSVGEISGAGFQLFTRLVNRATQSEVARIRTGMVFFDYTRRRPVPAPEEFSKKFRGRPSPDAIH